MSEPVTCEKCGTIGERSLQYPAPSGWYFLIARDENSHIDGDFYVYACSVTCRQALWQRGPGDPLEGGDRALRLLHGAYADGAPRPVPALSVAKPPPKCICSHGAGSHSADGCFHKNGHDIYCPCPWVPPSTPPQLGTSVRHKRDGRTGVVVRVGNSTYSVTWDDGTWNTVPQEDVARLA